MLLAAMSLSRILQVYVLQLGMGIFLLIMGLLILKRDKKKLNAVLSMYFFFVFAGTLLNVIYAPLTDIPIATFLSYMTVFCLMFSMVFLLAFNLIILRSEKLFDTKKQLVLITVYGALLLLGMLIPDGIIIKESNEYIPYWTLPYYAYITTIAVIGAIIPTLYTSLKIYTHFKDPDLKRKWRYYILGISAYFIDSQAISFANYLNDPTFRLIWNIIALTLFISAYLIYYGVGKQIEKK